jgi:uncharacterized damage-inducible protein DinB
VFDVKLQEFVAKGTEEAGKNLFRTAKAMPADKLTWKPSDTARSALDQLQECAQAALWFLPMVMEHKSPSFKPEQFEEGRKARQQWDTLEKCEQVFWENTNKLLAAIRDAKDEDLGIQIQIPFAENWVASLAEVLLFHYWNTTYHHGQINYIQTIYGDTEMH